MRELLEGLDNARMLEPAQSVSWGGFSITLTALFGLSTLVEWSRDWDYFINLRYFFFCNCLMCTEYMCVCTMSCCCIYLGVFSLFAGNSFCVVYGIVPWCCVFTLWKRLWGRSVPECATYTCTEQQRPKRCADQDGWGLGARVLWWPVFGAGVHAVVVLGKSCCLSLVVDGRAGRTDERRAMPAMGLPFMWLKCALRTPVKTRVMGPAVVCHASHGWQKYCCGLVAVARGLWNVCKSSRGV